MHQTAVGSAVVHETKLLAPTPMPGWVERPALAYELERGAGVRLTLVSAPAGFGTTRLLAPWAHTSSLRVAGLSIEE